MATKKFVPFVTDFPKPVALKPPPKKPLLGGILQDTADGGVPGQRIGSYAPLAGSYYGQPLYQPPGNLKSGTTVNFGEWGNQGWPRATGPDWTDIAPPGSTDSGMAPKPKSGYISTLFDDPMYQNALGLYNSRLQAGRTNLRDAIRQSVISSGYVPKWGAAGNEDLAAYANDLDQQTLDAASGNQMSQKAQLARNYAQQQNNLDYQLAARGGGLVQGGAHAVGAGLLQDQRDLTEYQQMGALIGAIRGRAGDYLNLQGTEGQTLNDALAGVATRLGSSYGPVYGDTTSNPALAGEYGTPTMEEATGATGTAPGAVSWGGRQFTSQADLAAYLRSIPGGLTPERFALTHPGAWRRLT